MEKHKKVRQEILDAYAILGIQKTVSNKEIHQVFRKLAKQYHPDLNQSDPDAKAKFLKLLNAYEIIKADMRWKPTLSTQNPNSFQGHSVSFAKIRQSFSRFNRQNWGRIGLDFFAVVAMSLCAVTIMLYIIWANTETDWIPYCCS